MVTWRRVLLELTAYVVGMVVAGALVVLVGFAGYKVGWETGFVQGGYEFKRDLDLARIDAERARHELKYVQRERDKALLDAAKARVRGYTPPRIPEDHLVPRDTTKKGKANG